MKINSNTILVEKGSAEFDQIEGILKKIAEDNKISNVKTASISLTKEDGVVSFEIKKEAQMPTVTMEPSMNLIGRFNDDPNQLNIEELNALLTDLQNPEINVTGGGKPEDNSYIGRVNAAIAQKQGETEALWQAGSFSPAPTTY
jgi:hypothetical protein